MRLHVSLRELDADNFTPTTDLDGYHKLFTCF